MSDDEEYMRDVFCMQSSDHHPAASTIINTSFKRSVIRRPNRAQGFLNTMKPAWRKLPSGLLVCDRHSFQYDKSRIGRVMKKITRGVFFKYTGKPLPSDHVIKVKANLKRAEFDKILNVFSDLKPLGPIQLGNDTVHFTGIRPLPNQSMWMYVFYNHIPVIATTEPPS